jgi:hypothetical protein
MKHATLELVLVSLTLSVTALAGPHGSKRPDPKEPINVAYRDIGFMEANKSDLAHSGAGTQGKRLAGDAQACSDEVKRRLGAGDTADTDVAVMSFSGDHKQLKLGDVEATVCKVVADGAASWDNSIKDAHGKENDRIAAPYKAVGITGDKLDFAVKQNDSDFYGVGGNVLKTPEDLKKASVVFILNGGAGTKYTLWRRQFNGDKLVGTSSADYLKKPPASAYH